MRLRVLDEPELEFRAGNRHVDPRLGLSLFGPADADSQTSPSRIAVGLVGSAKNVSAMREWLTRCREPITGKLAKLGQENMHPDFPGFQLDGSFNAELVFDDSLVRILADADLRGLSTASPLEVGRVAADMHLDAATSLDETGRCNLIICARPDELRDDSAAASSNGDDEEGSDDQQSDFRPAGFHHVLKARGLTLGRPIQVMRQETWSGKALPGSDRNRALQDEATRAWNLHTALYYKAGGTPWRLPRRSTDLATCFLGVSFYRGAEAKLHTAVAQIFNERGDGVVVRGGVAKIERFDKQPHLASREDARELVAQALSEFRRTHGHAPARIVLHKTSRFTEVERDGFRAGAEAAGIGHCELIWVQRRGTPKLFRSGQLPPLRGTTLQLDEEAIVVYTRGSIELFRTYPGLYVPQPLMLRCDAGTDLLNTAGDVLALSKMNWNNAQLDERDPLTLRTSSRVGEILKHAPAEQAIASRYAFYM